MRKVKLSEKCRFLIKTAAENGHLIKEGFMPKSYGDHKSADRIFATLELDAVTKRDMADMSTSVVGYALEESDFSVLKRIVDTVPRMFSLKERVAVIALGSRIDSAEEVKKKAK